MSQAVPLRLSLAAAAALAAGAAAAPAESGLGAEAARRLEAWEEGLRESPSFRRALVAASAAARREGEPGPGRAAAARIGGRPVLLVDARRAAALSREEGMAQWALALCRAGFAAPIPLVEAEQAAWQRALRVFVELAASDEAFGRALEREYARAAQAERGRAAAPEPGEPVLARAGRYLRLFEAAPEEFESAVEREEARGAESLAALEDLHELRGRELRALAAPPSGPYAALGPRRYPAALVRSALALREGGRLALAREALEAYDTVGALELREAFLRWRRGPLRAP